MRPPAIPPVDPALAERPFWSVMIPAFNPNPQYLEQTLQSVLHAGSGDHGMQIEVLDNASDNCDVEALVRRVAGNRVSVHRHATNIGGLENWNACIERARGEWVHILHADDLVLEGFYTRLRDGLAGNAAVGAAFCRHAHITTDGQPVYVSDLEQEEPGVLSGWLARLAVKQLIQCASIVVRRSVYEHLGGFWSEPKTALDWEMWMRISASYPVWYHPEIMACYRLHASSGTSTLIETAALTADMGLAMDLARAYLPADQRDELTRLGKQHYARSAFQNALSLMERGNHSAAIAHVEEGLKLDPSPQMASIAEQILSRLPPPALTGTGTKMGTAMQIHAAFFGHEEVQNIELLLKTYRENPPDGAEELKSLRLGLVDYITKAELQALEQLFQSDLGHVYRLMLKSGLQNELLNEEEARLADALGAAVCDTPDRSGCFDPRQLLAFMLFRLAHHASAPTALESVPAWFLDDYLEYVFHPPLVCMRPAESELYHIHILDWARSIDERIKKAPEAHMTLRSALFFTQHLNVIPFYFTRANVKEVMARRAHIMEFTLKKSGALVDATFPARPAGRTRIKVGFLNAHFGQQTETYTTLPTMRLDRERFEVCLFALQVGGGVVEDYCRSISDAFVHLPPALSDQARVIREAALDVILIGTNVTAVTNKIALLALHRLAPIQLVTYNSPLTSGMRNVDFYLTGKLTHFEGAGDHHTEKLLMLDGSPSGFDFSVDSQAAQRTFDRSSLGIPKDSVVFVSGATCYKIIPEMQETWANILKEVDNSRLLLIPFNPNWASGFPVKQFERSLKEVFRRHGIDESRLILAPALPNRSEVMEMQKLGDIYLDTFPFTGSISMVDPFELGIPTVVRQAVTQRARLAASMLIELQMPELIVASEEAYIELAIRLATDSTYRLDLGAKLKARMASNPPFLDSSAIGRQLGALLEDLVVIPKDAFSTNNATPLQPAPELMRKAIAAHTSGRLGDAEDYCRQAIKADPCIADAWHLLGVLAHQSGKSERAVELINQALEFDPDNATYLSNLGEALRAAGTLEKAIECCRRALDLQPEFPEAMVNLATALKERGEPEEAMCLFQKAIRLNPRYPEGLLQYGLALLEANRMPEALAALGKACIAAPTSVEARYHLAVAQETSKQFPESLKSYQKAITINPHVGAVWHGWGKLLIRLQDYSRAMEVLKEAVRCHPDHPDCNYDFACALQSCRRPADALVYFDKAMKCGLDTPELNNNRGIALKDLGQLREAAQSFSRAILLKPGMISALNNLGAVCSDLGLFTEALECFQHVIARQTDMPGTLNNIARLLKDRGKAAEALDFYQRSLQAKPDSPETQDNQLLCLQYVPDADPHEVFEKHRQWGLSVSKRVRPAFQHKSNSSSKERRLRIGYVSPDFCQHPVGTFIEPLMTGHDRRHFEVYAYSDVRTPDTVTKRLMKQANVWRETAGLTHRELAQTVRNDRIDILVELSGHTALNRLEMIALKPAPIQVSYLGYPSTTGLPAIDYRISDILADPPGTTDHLNTEHLVQLAGCAWCYQPPGADVSPAPLPSDRNGYVTFGCFNQMAKLNSRLFELWVAILQRASGSHLKLKARTLQDETVRRELTDFFVERGIDENRLEFSGYAPTIREHLEEYHCVDIALDTFPYHGTTTTCEALWMGIPVVSLAGQTHVSRVGVSLLNAVGLPEAVAFTPDGYVDVAAALAEDSERLQWLRKNLRSQMQASLLMDRKAFTTAMEQCFRQMFSETNQTSKPALKLNQ